MNKGLQSEKVTNCGTKVTNCGSKKLNLVTVLFFSYLCFMKEQIIAQDNRISSARYELSLIEKKILYILVREIREKFVLNTDGNKTLFQDLVIKTTANTLIKGIKEKNYKRVRKAFVDLRMRSFSWDNGKDIEKEQDEYEGFEVGFINYSKWDKNGDIEFEVSKLILPFFVELTKKFTEYNLIVAISLKSKWSQRFYEICSQWKNAGGINLNIKELREQFGLIDKYTKYAAFKSRVIDVAHKELKELFMKGQNDVYFEFSEVKSSRSVESLKLKIITKDKSKKVAETVDVSHLVRNDLYTIFEVDKKPKNKEKIQKLLSNLILNTEQLYVVFGKIQYTKDNKPKSEWQKYLRAVFNIEYDFKNL